MKLGGRIFHKVLVLRFFFLGKERFLTNRKCFICFYDAAGLSLDLIQKRTVRQHGQKVITNGRVGD